MRSPFIRHISPSNSQKKCWFSSVRILCTGTYLLVFFAISLWFPSKPFTHSQEEHFHVAPGEAPVLNDTGNLKFSNIPMSSWRPQNQFFSTGRSSTFGRAGAGETPILTVITVTKNAREVIRDTARFMLEQSLLPIKWLIVNDHTDLSKSYQLLKHIASLDPRFNLVNSTREPGFTNGRKFALNSLRSAPTKYFAFLDDDDFFEYTAYEKCVWTLESNVNASMCGTYVVGFGERNYTWKYGFHSGYKVVLNNPLTGSEILRTSVLDTDCEFDESLKTGMEDWDFYLCLASRGLWGVTVPEYMFWYRINPESLRKKRWGSLFEERGDKSTEIRERYKELEHNFPKVAIEGTTEFEVFKLSRPFKNELHLKDSVLMIIPWMALKEGDIANIHLVQELSRRGYRVTIVCTLLNLRGDSTASRSFFMQYTHDVFIIPGIIRLADAPRFLAYLIQSRNVQRVLISNSQLGYGVLPWLSTRFPEVIFADFVHSEEPDWKNGGYVTFSRIHQTSLDATFTSSESLRQKMIGQGHDSSRIIVGKTGLDLKLQHPLQDETQAAARFKLGIPAGAVVVVFLARTVAFRRAKVATAAFLQVAKSTGEKGAENMSNRVRLLIIGDGPAIEESKRISAPYGNVVTVLGSLRHSEALKYLELADIFCLPSPSKSISFVLTESRKIGIAALTSTIGGYPELLVQHTDTADDVTIVRHSGTSKKDVLELTDVMNTTVTNVMARKELEHRVTDHVQRSGEAKERISTFVNHILALKRTRKHRGGAHTELSALHYALLPVLKDVGVFSDFPETHRTVQGKDRGAYGTRYRAVCGERVDSAARIIDLLENPKPCVEGGELNIKKMQAAAMLQCWRSCIMDPDDPNLQSGWQAKEKCQGFETFNDPVHMCATWYKSLPPEKQL